MLIRKFLQTALISIFILSGTVASQATHIMGGTVTYKYLGSNKYALEFIIYRDCKGAAYLHPAIIYWVRPASSKTSNPVSHTIPIFDSVDVTNANATCGATYCVQRGRYRDTITEGTDTVGYHVYYDTCSRNGAITNLSNPGTYGMVWYTFLPPRGTANNSPSLVKDMTPNICLKKTNIFDAGFYDPDGDSLVFSIVTPYDSSPSNPPPHFNYVAYASGYSLKYPFGTSAPAITIDSSTGVITASPQKTGFFVVAVQVQDWRVDKLTHKALKMSTVRVDLQFVVVDCGTNPAPVFASDASYKRTIEVGQKFCMNIKVYDTVKYKGLYDTVTLTATSALFGNAGSFPKPYASFTPVKAWKKDSSTFCWTPSCDHITYSQPHTVIFQATDQGCNVTQQTWSIYVKPKPFVSPPTLRGVSILGSQYIKLQWDTIKKDTNFSKYNIYRSTSASSGYTLVKSIGNYKTSSWTDSSASNAQTMSYYYYIASANSCNTDGFNSDTLQSVIVTIKNVSTGGLEFDWNSLGYTYKDSFAVYADTGTGMKYLGTVKAHKYLYTLCNIKAVKAQVIGLSKYTSFQSISNISQPAADTAKPVKSKVLVATVVSSTDIDIVFNKTTSSIENIEHYTIYRSANGGTLLPIDSIYTLGSGTTLTYSDTKATPGSVSYCYAVAAVDYCGNRVMYDKHCAIKASIQAQQRALKVTWTPYSGFVPDTVKVQQLVGTNWVTRKLVKAADTMYQDTGITCVARSYRIAALSNTNKQTAYSNVVTGTPFDNVIPNAPPLVYITYDATAANQIDYKFLYVPDKDVAGYKLYTWIDGVLQSIPTALTSGTYPGSVTAIKSVTAGKSYCYDYVAVDSCGNTSLVKAHCTMVLSGVGAQMSAILKWTGFHETGLIKYYLEKKNSSGTWVTVDSTGVTGSPTDTTLTENNLVCNTAVNYRVRASLTGNGSSYSNTATVTPIDTATPAAPVIDYVTVKSATSIFISWKPSVSKIVDRYNIQFRNPTGIWQDWPLSTKKDTMTITGLKTMDSIYDFRVIAVDSCAGNKSNASAFHRSIRLKAQALNLSNNLVFNSYLGFNVKQYDVYSNLSGSWTKIATVLPSAGSTMSYLDTGLHCNVPYYYKVQAISAASSSVTSWSDSTSATPTDTTRPAAPVINYANIYASGKISLSWQKSASKKAIFYQTQYKTKNSPTWTTHIKITPNLADTFTGLNTLDSVYDFRVLSIDTCQNNISLHGNDQETMHPAGTAQNLASLINWNAYLGFSVKEYDIYSYLSGSWVKVAAVSGSTTSYTNTSLKCNTPYYYKIKAISNVSASYFSWSDSTTATPFDTIKPQQVNIRSVTVLSTSSTQISFDKVADPVVTKYLVYVSQNGGSYSLLTTITKPATNPVTYKHTSINTTTDTFDYQVYAVDSCAGNTSPTSQTHQPVRLSGIAGNYAAALTWTKYKGFSVQSYVVEYYQAGWKTLATVNSSTTSYTDGPIPCVYKYYRIRVVPVSGTASSVSDTIRLLPYDKIVPDAPVIQYATVTSNGSVFLKWSKSLANDVRRYDIYRKPSSASTFTLVKSVGDVDNYTDYVNTDNDTAYCYAIKAVDSCANNNSVFSSTHCVVNMQADSNGCQQKIYLSWTPYAGWTSGVKNYQVYRRVQSSSTDVLLATLSGTASTYVDSTMSNTKSYCYSVVAVQNSGTYTSSSNRSCSKIYQPLAPQMYSASKTTTSATNGTVVIKWKSVSGQRFYRFCRLYYKPASGSSFTLLKDSIPVAKDSFVHTGIDTKTQDHDYYIEMVDSCGNVTPPSKVHQTMTINIAVGQLIHNINWTAYSGFGIKYYYVQRLEKGKFVNIDSVSPANIKDVIFPAPCNYNIFYRIKAADSFGHYAWSDTMGRQAIDTIPSNAPTFNNASVVNSNTVQINFYGADSADTWAYYVQRSTNGSWTTAGRVYFTSPHAAHVYMDNINTQKDEHCYTIITLDSCLNATAADTFCTITLTGKPLQEANKMNWTKFRGYNLANYTVLTLKGNTWTPLSVLKTSDTALIHDSLHCSLPYYYKVMGTEKGGNRVTYSDSIQLIPFDTIIPPATKLEYASVYAGGRVKLLWDYNPKTDVKYFEIWRKKNGGAFALIDTVVKDSIYYDKKVNVHTDTLSYYVIAIDSCDASHRAAPSDTDRMMNLNMHTRACVPWIHLNWSAYKSLPGGTDSFIIYRVAGFGIPQKLASVPGNTLLYDDYAVSTGTRYTYILAARSKKTGLISITDTFSLVPFVYPAPNTSKLLYTTIAKSGYTDGSVHFQWVREPVTDSFARGYKIYEQAPSGSWTQIYQTANLADTAVTVPGINTMTAVHNYKLAVYNLCNLDGGYGTAHSPVNLQAVNGNLQAKLVWTQYRGLTAAGYDLYKKVDKGAFHFVQTFSPNDTTYTDTGYVCLHRYTYRIVVRMTNKIISQSDSFGVTGSDTIAPPKAPLYVISTDSTLKAGGQISMRFYGNNKVSRSGYNIYRQVNNGPFTRYFYLNTIKTDTIYWQDEHANTVDNTYAYYVRSLDSCGNEAMPADTHRVVNLHARAISQHILLSWTPYLGFKNWKYVLEKRTLHTSWQPITSFNNTVLSYNDSNVNCHVYYMYRIRTTDLNSGLYSFSNWAADTAYDTVPPKISEVRSASVIKTGQTDGVVQLNWNASVTKNNYGYLVYRSKDSIVWAQAHPMIIGTTYNDSGLNTWGQPYYYRITPIDTCGNTGIGFSVTHKTIRVKAQAGNQQVSLKWNAYRGWKIKGYNIYRDGKLLNSMPKDSLHYIDTIATCTNMYHYTIEAVADSIVPLTAMSNIDSARPYDHIGPRKVYIRSASVDVSAGQVVVSWVASTSFDVKDYLVYRKRALDGQMILVDSTDKTIYTEPLTDIHGPDCYYVFARDHCGNRSDGSNRACLIILEGQNHKGYNSLTWNTYRDWADGIQQYNVYKDEDLAGWKNIGFTPNTTTTYDDYGLTDDVVDYCYQVEAVENNGQYNATSRSTMVCLHQDPILYVPDAFTPVTTVGINDYFFPKGMFVKSYQMDIYNRWGELIFTGENGKWDGTYKGKLVPDGVYMYVIKVEGYNNNSFYYKGNMTVLY